jgi:short-subunit dehydrogenase
VAEAIVGAIEAEKRDLILGARGKAMAFLDRTAPRMVENAMRKIAAELREEE